MLIAVMGNTFDKVSDNKALRGGMLTEKIEIMSEYRAIFNLFEPNLLFFIIIKPDNENLEFKQEWEGRIAAIKHEIRQSTTQMNIDIQSSQN